MFLFVPVLIEIGLIDISNVFIYNLPPSSQLGKKTRNLSYNHLNTNKRHKPFTLTLLGCKGSRRQNEEIKFEIGMNVKSAMKQLKLKRGKHVFAPRWLARVN